MDIFFEGDYRIGEWDVSTDSYRVISEPVL